MRRIKPLGDGWKNQDKKGQISESKKRWKEKIKGERDEKRTLTS